MKKKFLSEGVVLRKLQLEKVFKMTGIFVFLLVGCVWHLYAENAKTAPVRDDVASSQQQQTKRITGTVVDGNGEPIIGANVLQKGNSSNGTVTDTEGKFSLNVPPNATLQISFIGYLTKEVATGEQSSIDIALTEDVGLLEEVVVIGYGTQKKTSVTGAIASLQTEKIENIPVANVSNALAGRMSGLYVNQISGAPGYAAAIRIRSINTWKSSGNDPLYVIDGIILDKRSFDMLDYSEIENISVLKDAASASVYGARAANGVILVTTRTGKEGKFKLNYNYSYSFDQPLKTLKYGSSADMVRLNNYARSVAGIQPLFDEEEVAYFNQNDPGKAWFDLAYRDPTLQKHTLNASGGSENYSNDHLASTFWLENGNYIRLQQLSLKYSLPKIDMRTISKIAGILVGMFTFMQCSDPLDKENLAAITSDLVWSNPQIAEACVNDMYASFMPGFDTGEFSNTDEGGVTYGVSTISAYIRGSIISNSYDYYPYDDIRRINIFLDNIDGATFGEDVRNSLKGQALFWRAWAYFRMVRAYGGVPLILKPADPSDEEAIFVPRNKTS
ncbi:MAG: carboxypeptidase-like regulatory domain-containing protein, partial [Proteiniphilum sp.]|nr:carboxypeptidase-like regulatory domain-containing protein [Proteiniphilum sp.]